MNLGRLERGFQHVQGWEAGAGNAPHLFCKGFQFIYLQWLAQLQDKGRLQSLSA